MNNSCKTCPQLAQATEQMPKMKLHGSITKNHGELYTSGLTVILSQ